VKDRQCLLNVRSGDFNFIAEDHLSAIFSTMATHRIRANVMQHSALNFSVCTDEQPERLQACMDALRNLGFQVSVMENLSLLTVYNRQHDQYTGGILSGREILMEQNLAHTVQYIIR
jgi:aspartate kinase